MDSREPIHVRLLGESELVRHGLAAMLRPYDDIVLLPRGHRQDQEPPSPADITLFDAPADVSAGTLVALARRPDTGRLVLYGDPVRLGTTVALLAGAIGSLSRDLPAEALVSAFRRIVAGETVIRERDSEPADELVRVGLTEREAQMVGLIATGVSNDEIARMTHLSINSVKSYIRGAYGKIAVTSRSQAILWAVRNGCVGPEASGLARSRRSQGGPAHVA